MPTRAAEKKNCNSQRFTSSLRCVFFLRQPNGTNADVPRLPAGAMRVLAVPGVRQGDLGVPGPGRGAAGAAHDARAAGRDFLERGILWKLD